MSQKIYKIMRQAEWTVARANGTYLGSPDDLRDGFIHFSTAAQLEGTLRKHFAGETGLVVCEIDSAALGSTLRWEPSRDGQLFPHLYGSLPLSAIEKSSSVGEGPWE